MNRIIEWFMIRIRHYLQKCINLFSSPKTVKERFITHHNRPKIADEIMAFVPEEISDVAIVLQGPLKREDDFTMETVKLYRKYYPKTPIIVSTWDTEPEADIDRIKAECGENRVVVSHFWSGDCPNNYQRVSALSGVKIAQVTGCKFILKTRTDQRIYASNVLSFLIKLWSDFPINIKCVANGRLITCGMCTFSNRLYNISDMFVFGKTEDIVRYYSCPEDGKHDVTQIKKPIPNDYPTFMQYTAEYSKLRTGEIWFTTHYIESFGFDLKWTFEDSDFYRNELFIIVDDAMLDFYWPKYTNQEYRWRNYVTKDVLHQVSFMEWYMQQKVKS